MHLYGDTVVLGFNMCEQALQHFSSTFFKSLLYLSFFTSCLDRTSCHFARSSQSRHIHFLLSTMSSSTCTPVADNLTARRRHDGSSARQRRPPRPITEGPSPWRTPFLLEPQTSFRQGLPHLEETAPGTRTCNSFQSKTRNKMNVSFADRTNVPLVSSPSFRRTVPHEVTVPASMNGSEHANRTFERQSTVIEAGAGVRSMGMSNEELVRRLKTANDKVRVKSDAFDLIYSQWQSTQQELYEKKKSEAALQARLALLEKRLQDKDAVIEELAFKLSFVEPSDGAKPERVYQDGKENDRRCRPSLVRTPRFKRGNSPGSGSRRFPRHPGDELDSSTRSVQLRTPPCNQTTTSFRADVQERKSSPDESFSLTRSGFFSGLAFRSRRGVETADGDDKSRRESVPGNKQNEHPKSNHQASLANSFSLSRSFRSLGKKREKEKH